MEDEIIVADIYIKNEILFYIENYPKG